MMVTHTTHSCPPFSLFLFLSRVFPHSEQVLRLVLLWNFWCALLVQAKTFCANASSQALLVLLLDYVRWLWLVLAV